MRPEDYENSLSWRLTRPLRDGARLLRGLRGGEGPPPQQAPAAPAEPRYDAWLDELFGEELRRIDAACRDAGPDALALFGGLDDDLWALLLTREYDGYQHIKAVLPEVPEPFLQMAWTGTSGIQLAEQSAAFVRLLRARYERHGHRPLGESRVLDYGCGWGRLTRVVARDVAPGSLYGCDPTQSILDRCRADRVPGTFGLIDFSPDRIPFDEPFDLVFAFSVFTHLSEPAHEASLAAIHTAMAPGAVLVATIRPPAYLAESPLMAEVAATPLDGARYVFAPHAVEGDHPQYGGGEMTYGETVITLDYVRERWGGRFELLDVDIMLADPHQVVLTLRRR